MTFGRLTEANRPRFVIEQVMLSIKDGTLHPGERLPSEAKLAELTGVGRTSVREALAALRLMGVIETRVGDGSYVRDAVNADTVSNGIAQAIQQSEEAVQLQEARAVFECGLVRLAIERWSSEKAKSFARLLSSMENSAVSEGYAEYIRLHRDFHLLLAQATDNAVVERTERSFLEFMDHEGWRDMEQQLYLPNRREYMNESVAEHREIVEAISRGDGRRAADLMHTHFARHGEGDNG